MHLLIIHVSLDCLELQAGLKKLQYAYTHKRHIKLKSRK